MATGLTIPQTSKMLSILYLINLAGSLSVLLLFAHLRKYINLIIPLYIIIFKFYYSFVHITSRYEIITKCIKNTTKYINYAFWCVLFNYFTAIINGCLKFEVLLLFFIFFFKFWNTFLTWSQGRLYRLTFWRDLKSF